MYACTAWSFVRWLGMVITMLLAITWLTSNWWSVNIQTKTGAWARLADGRIAAGPALDGTRECDPSFDLYRRPAASAMHWGFEWGDAAVQPWVAVPIWAPMALTAFIAIAYRRPRPASTYR